MVVSQFRQMYTLLFIVVNQCVIYFIKKVNACENSIVIMSTSYFQYMACTDRLHGRSKLWKLLLFWKILFHIQLAPKMFST